MSISLSDASLKTYRQLLPASLAIMKKAEKYFTDQGANLNDLAEMRLIEDMAPLTFQVFSIVHHSVGAIEALRTGEFSPPKMPDDLSFNGFKLKIDGIPSDGDQFSLKPALSNASAFSFLLNLNGCQIQQDYHHLKQKLYQHHYLRMLTWMEGSRPGNLTFSRI